MDDELVPVGKLDNLVNGLTYLLALCSPKKTKEEERRNNKRKNEPDTHLCELLGGWVPGKIHQPSPVS
jgi:hypothetical protein